MIINPIGTNSKGATTIAKTCPCQFKFIIVTKTIDVYYLENADTPLFTRPSYKNVNMKVVSQ